MEYNKDESIRCLELANTYLTKGDKGKALKFASKSEKLYPSDNAKALLDKIHRLGCSNGSTTGASGSTNDTKSCQDDIRRRHKSESNGVNNDYTPEQVSAVNRIKRCKDYYEILGIARKADDSEIKRRYRKLALQFHPDKNHAPGAAEAFKAIGNAFSVLSDREKRRKYDLTGGTETSHSHPHTHRDWDYSHGFESDLTPEEIFNMFFGGSGFTTTSHTSNGNGATAHTFRRHHHHNSDQDWHQLLLQLSPVIVLVVLSLLSMSYTGENPYSFVQNTQYSEKRFTESLKAVYFVMSDFTKKYNRAAVLRLEQEIEGVYVSNLRRECFQERATKEEMKRQAQYNNDAREFELAEKFEMKSCIKLESLYT